MGVLFINANMDNVEASVKLTRRASANGAIKGTVIDALLASCVPVRGDAVPLQEPMFLPRPGVPGKFYIHSRGPFRSTNPDQNKELLAIWYCRCIKLAYNNHCKNVQIPLISDDVYPNEKAIQIAYEACHNYLFWNKMDLNVYILINPSYANPDRVNMQDKETRNRNRMRFIRSSLYIRNYYSTELGVGELFSVSWNYSEANPFFEILITNHRYDRDDTRSASAVKADLSEIYCRERKIKHLYQETIEPPSSVEIREKETGDRVYDQIQYSISTVPDKKDIVIEETFRDMLLRLMNEKDMTAPEIYTKACMDRKLFSKIQSSGDYQPRKYTVVRLALALNLSLDEANTFINTAGFALSHGKIKDLLIEYCIRNDIKSVDDVNEVLKEWGLTEI